MIIQLIQFLALFLLMLVTGVFWGPWLSLHRSLHIFNAEEFIRLVRTLASNLAAPMRLLIPACIALLITSACLCPQKSSPQFYLSISACVFTIVSLLVTLLVEVPIVSDIQTWTAATVPTGWEAKRDRWIKFHVVRMLVSLAGFACFTASVLFF